MKTNILAPFIKTEESFNFYVNGRAFEMKDNNLNLIESFGSELRNSIAAFESFEFGSNSIKWFHGPSKFVFDINESKFKHNDSLIEGNTFTNHVLSAGMVRYNDKPKAELFESLPTLLSNFIVLDFAATFEGNSNIVDVFKLDEKVYVSRFNTENRIANFFLAENANAAVDYVTEKTGENALSFLSELVEGQAKELADKEAKIAECNEMIAFLKDQRGLLAEADKSIPEIKAADVLINEEITNWELVKELINEAKVNYDFSEEELKRVLKLLGRNASTEVKMIKAFEKAFGRKLTRDELFESVNEEKLKFKIGDFIKQKNGGNFEYEIKSIDPKFDAVEVYLDTTGKSTKYTFKHINKNWELVKESVNEAKAWDKLNKAAEEVHGEFGFASLNSAEMAGHIDMKAADKLADKMFGETGFASLSEEDMEELINKNPKLVKESVNEGKKRFRQQNNIGKAKYTISYHDGEKKHKDGSDFFDIKIFKNKSDLEKFKKELLTKGYTEL